MRTRCNKKLCFGKDDSASIVHSTYICRGEVGSGLRSAIAKVLTLTLTPTLTLLTLLTLTLTLNLGYSGEVMGC